VPTVPPEVVENRSETRHVYALINALRRLVFGPEGEMTIGSNGRIRFNETTGVLEYSNDAGTTYTPIT
jgi:hypothetical protein